MNHNWYEERFLFAIDNALKSDELSLFNQHLENCDKCKNAYQKQQTVFDLAHSVARESYELEEGFADKVMLQINSSNCVLVVWRFIMKWLKSSLLFVGKIVRSLIALAALFLLVLIVLHAIRGQYGILYPVSRFLAIIEGSFGALVMVISFLATITFIIMGRFKQRMWLYSTTFASIFIAAFIVRSSVRFYSDTITFLEGSERCEDIESDGWDEEITTSSIHSERTSPQAFLNESDYIPKQPPYSREDYRHSDENQFLEVNQNPLSTFSIDVDKASYANVRRFLTAGQLPPIDAVRIEELVNYFDYKYQGPNNDVPFNVITDVSECPWAKSHKLVRIGIQGQRMENAQLPASNLVFLIDSSGSMDESNKLPLVKKALGLLVEQLRDQDRVAIVVYAGSAGETLPSTPGSNKQEILAAIDKLQAGGSTAGGAGIELAYKIAKRNFIATGNNRVILATDGDFNVGTSSEGELVRMIEAKREDGIFLSILGVGTGNYQDAKMEALADKGNGNFSYLDNIREAKKVLVTEMGGTLFTIAKDVKIQVEFNPAKVKAYRLIGYENRMLAKEDFNDDKKDAGELGAGHSVTALYELIPAGSDENVASVDELKYQKVVTEQKVEFGDELMTVKLRYKAPDGDISKLITKTVQGQNISITEAPESMRFATAVAEFGMLLRNSSFKGDSNFEQAKSLAKGAKGEDDDGIRAEFINLIEEASLIK